MFRGNAGTAGGSVIRRSIGRFATLSMLALVILGVGTVLASRDIAEEEARRDAESRAMGLANAAAAPLVDRAVRAGAPGAAATLGLVLRNRIAEGSVQHVKLWAADGTVIWADNEALVGRRFRQPAEVRALYGTRAATFELSELNEPDNAGEAGEAPLLEVYVGSFDADGQPFVFETYTSAHRIDRDRAAVLRRLLPAGLGILVIFEGAVLVLAFLLARDVDRAQRHRADIIQRAAASWHRERRRLAQDLHDGVIQDIAAVSYALPAVLEALPDDVPGTVSRATGDRLGVLLREDLAALRSMVTDLYPADLSPDGLRRAITELFPRVPGVHIELELEDDLGIGPEAAGLVYRVTREALQNVGRHACADRAWVRVERVDDVVQVVVSDDGRGLRGGADRLVPHHGMMLLEHLLRDAGGTITMRDHDRRGTVVVGRIPAGFGDQG